MPVATPSLLAMQNEVTAVVARAKPSVVTIVCEKPRSAAYEDDEKPPAADPLLPIGSLGTGWVCRADGLILTNYHVVRDATSIHISFNANADSDIEDIERGIGIPARVVGYDPDYDLAVLKIDRVNLPALELADSDAARTGQWTIAVGAPFGQSQTVTLGILAGRARHIDEAPSAQTYFQSDAALNPGNSGGPLLDLSGRVVGVNTEAAMRSKNFGGMGFSIPANTIRALLPRLVAGNRVQHASLGASLATLAPDAAREFGLDGGTLISSLAQKGGADFGPAKDADVRRGDIIIGVDGKPITTPDELGFLFLSRAPGDKLSLSIARPDFEEVGNVQKLTVPIVLGDSALLNGDDAPASLPAPAPARVVGSGLSVVDASALDAAHKDRFELDGTESGAVILEVAPTSRADEAGLTAGLRLVRVRLNEKWTKIASAQEWNRFEASAQPGAHLLLQLRDTDDTSEFRVLILPPKIK